MDATLDVDTPLPLSLRTARIEDAAVGIHVIAVQRDAQGQGGAASRIEGAIVGITRARPAVPRFEVVDELLGTVRHRHAPLHDGAWGRATLQICLAMLESAREQREVELA